MPPQILPAAPPPPSDAAAVADRLHSAAIHLLRGLRKQDQAAGLTAARLSALSAVVFGGPVTMGQLADAEQVRAPTMTRLVAGMERDGLLQRRGDARDRRVVWIRATSRGTRILIDARRRRVAKLARALGAIAPAQLRQLARAAGLIETVALRARGPD